MYDQSFDIKMFWYSWFSPGKILNTQLKHSLFWAFVMLRSPQQSGSWTTATFMLCKQKCLKNIAPSPEVSFCLSFLHFKWQHNPSWFLWKECDSFQINHPPLFSLVWLAPRKRLHNHCSPVPTPGGAGSLPATPWAFNMRGCRRAEALTWVQSVAVGPWC